MKYGTIEALESRRLLATTTVGVYSSIGNASETSPTSTGKGEFLIKRPTGSTSKALLVEYYVRNTSTATSGTDFQALGGSVTIPKGKRSAKVPLIPINDSEDEPNEVVTLVVRDGNYTVVRRKSNVTIADNDPPPQVGIYAGDATAWETDPSSAGRGQFVFKRTTGSTAKPLVLSYYLRTTSTATSGDDFVELPGSITIPVGKRSVNLNLTPVDDDTDEPDEVVTLVLRNGNFENIRNRASVTIADNDEPIPADWFGEERRYRKTISINNSEDVARVDQPVDVAFNFSDVLDELSASGSLEDNSLLVVEVNADGSAVVDGVVPFQFDKDSDFNAGTNAAGNLIIAPEGATAANTTRYFQVYFDTTGTFAVPTFPAQVTTDEDESDEGQDAIKVVNQTATYWLQYENGGFSSIEDNEGNDWLSFNPTPGSESGGEFRGTPNAIFPGGGLHAGFDIGDTEVIHVGPLKTTVESTVTVPKGTYKMRYEFYGNFVRATMVEAEDSYWFLYEGTPGGAVDGNDTVVRSDGTETDISTSWNEDNGIGSVNEEEWLYFRDSDVDRFIYFVHNEADDLKDSYYRMDNNGSMTVFGFGRDNEAGSDDHLKMTAENNVFTFGIADGGGDFDDAAELIRGQYFALTGVLGEADAL